jgi:hypothetical protein
MASGDADDASAGPIASHARLPQPAPKAICRVGATHRKGCDDRDSSSSPFRTFGFSCARPQSSYQVESRGIEGGQRPELTPARNDDSPRKRTARTALATAARPCDYDIRRT